MSEATAEATGHEADAHHDHPSDLEYVKIAAILGAITAVEVATYFDSVITIFENRAFLITSLMVMMVVKFWLVARMFMHLKNDKPILSQAFGGGLALASAVYVIALLAFRFWG